jgi:hypothetical protein
MSRADRQSAVPMASLSAGVLSRRIAAIVGSTTSTFWVETGDVVSGNSPVGSVMLAILETLAARRACECWSL